MTGVAVVVEDDPGLTMIYRMVLEEVNFEVLQASDGGKAMDVLRDCVPDILFLDILLPNVNGLAVLDYMAEAEHLQSTQIVIVSSNLRFEQDILDMQLRQPLQFILKPIRPATIRELATNLAH